jgi:hypothetical protein
MIAKDKQIQNTLLNHLLSNKFQQLKYTKLQYIVPNIILQGCETWSFTVKDDHRQRMSEDKVRKNTWI